MSKPSVFDRLKKPSGDIRKEDGRRQNGLDSAIRTRMRMDTLRTTKNLDANSDFSSPGPQAETISSDQDEDVDEEKDPNLTVQNQPFNAPNSVATPAVTLHPNLSFLLEDYHYFLSNLFDFGNHFQQSNALFS